ncbi:hypothetical protein UFOVP669_53 [uncultured Caudovirales phage]|uniref:Uncharacterized protein n=1 Tax=uncultured Caudovirales phage TaxID=2100421 RepID=A0A6J5M381_9CAUD|nr:hypothetical protein UFOVP400_44 [uncultured Caudovirales phage]CAB4156258.1 hypothetical protein UFOVP669_53 [uncultured Caudovirales phage]CAB4213425.1 hypothetical protein UFOVP1449_19 [uncultured Caudovirales phage]
MPKTSSPDEKKKNDAMDAPIGTGMAGEAKKTLGEVMPAYRDYQMLKMTNGEKPVSIEEFKKGKR